jgi:hypothetical protein
VFTVTPKIERLSRPITPPIPLAIAAVAGKIFSRNQPFSNLSRSEHQGVDFGFRYALPRTAFGDFLIDSDWAYLDRALSTLAPANVAPTVNNGLYGGGAAKWRSTTNLNWRRNDWNIGLGIYDVGKTHDTGATTTEAVYQSLNQPSYIEPFFTAGRTVYRLVIDPVVSYNLTVGYRFQTSAPQWLRDSRLRLSVVNLTNKQPPLSAAGSDNFGYDPSVNQSLLAGRSWTLELNRKF